MTTDDTHSSTREHRSITDKQERIEEIIETLEDGEVSLERAKALHDEGRDLLDELETDLELGDGDVIENP